MFGHLLFKSFSPPPLMSDVVNLVIYPVLTDMCYEASICSHNSRLLSIFMYPGIVLYAD